MALSAESICARERGAALPFVLVVTAALIAIAIHFDLRARLAFDRSQRAAQMSQARSLLEMLQLSFSRMEAGQLERLADEEREFDVDGFHVTVRMSAPEGRININRLNDLLLGDPIQRLFSALAHRERLESRAVPSAMDWVDADNEPQPDGAERDDYLGEDVSPRNAPFETVDELSFVRGFRDESAFDRVRPQLTTFGSGKIYLRASDEKMIDLFVDAYGPVVRSYLVDLRRNPERGLQLPERVLPDRDMQSIQSIFSPEPTAWMITLTLSSRNFFTRAEYVLNVSDGSSPNHRITRLA